VERARFVVCISNYARSQLMGMVDIEQWDKLRIVHCGVDPTLFSPPDRSARDGVHELLVVGRLVAVKGQVLLIEALAELAERGIEARLTVVGDGPQLPELRTLAERRGVAARVEFAGAVGQDAVRLYYDRADVFALPSFAEGVPVVLMEAMGMELPVVASRINGIPELVEDGVSGALTAPGRLDELVAALEGLLTVSAQRRAEMGRAGRQKVVAEFALDRTTEQLLEVFRELVP
jgi:glycosyltransferase involved in cell wall biosynthesis